MTTQEAQHALVERAYGEVGYHEGANNYNKYAADERVQRLYGWNVQNQPWCNTFVNFLFINVFGYEEGAALTYGGSAGCAVHAQLYKNHGAWVTTPQKGDQIFFLVNGGINHTGIVADVSGATVTTIEGNYSDSVAKNSYYINDSRIAGYGRPNWSVVANDEEPEIEPVDDEDEDIIHPTHRRSHYRLEHGDGIDSPLPQVKAWQNLLLCWGMSVGGAGADGEFGDDTLEATKKWQTKARAYGADVEVNGIVDSDDWEEIVNVPVDQ